MSAYGVNLVTQHNRWNNLIQQLTGKATFEVCAFGLCREIIVPFTAQDIAEWAVKLSTWASLIGKDYSIPLGNGVTLVGDAYTPANTGEMPIVPVLYTDGIPEGSPPIYLYTPADPMDVVGVLP